MTDRPNASERRAFPRLKQSCELRYKLIEADGVRGEGGDALAVNISGGGIRFSAPEAIPEGSLLAIEFEMPEFEASIISMGRVIWCETLEGGRHEVGMEFWWVGWGDAGAQQAISDHIRQALEG